MKNKTIAIASGKGGTGKTTFAVNFALFLKETKNASVVLTDLDVEEPNSHLFLNMPVIDTPVYNYQPAHNKDLCTYCGKCAKSCEFNAIIAINNYWKLFPEMCHGCTLCEYICPKNAISASNREIGIIEVSTQKNFKHITGKLNIGETLTSELIKRAKDFTIKNSNNSIIIYDCPPGTTCPAVNAIKGSDIIILIVEPTPFGFHDFKLMMQVLEQMSIVPYVIINKFETETDVEKFCQKKSIPILSKIPFSKEIAEKYSKGEPIYKLQEISDIFKKIASELIK